MAIGLGLAAGMQAAVPAVELGWLGGVPAPVASGVSWGVPWPKGAVTKEQRFALTSDQGAALPLQTWALAYWPDGSVKWSPLSYSNFDFSTGQNFNDPLGGGNYINNTYYNAKWNHTWAERIKSEVALGTIKDKYDGLNRNDNTNSIGLKLNYEMQRWLTLGAEYTYTNRGSSNSAFDYKKNLMLFSAKIAL